MVSKGLPAPTSQKSPPLQQALVPGGSRPMGRPLPVCPTDVPDTGPPGPPLKCGFPVPAPSSWPRKAEQRPLELLRPTAEQWVEPTGLHVPIQAGGRGQRVLSNLASRRRGTANSRGKSGAGWAPPLCSYTTPGWLFKLSQDQTSGENSMHPTRPPEQEETAPLGLAP